MTIRPGRSIVPKALSDEERHHGLLSLNLVGTWDSWIKRRVESIELISETTVQRKVSVDFRMQSWLPPPVVTRDTHGVHYIPIALLNKGPLLEFDTRDETGRAIPLLTLRKSAAIAAATLSSLTQLLVWLQLRDLEANALKQSPGPLPDDPLLIRLPRSIEDEFVRIAHLPYQGEFGSRGRLDSFLCDTPALATRPADWEWKQCDGLWVAQVGDDVWRYEIARHRKLRALLEDLARLWMVSIPVRHVAPDRRIIKFSYYEHVMEPQVHVIGQIKYIADRVGAGARLGRVEDWLEGLPHDESRSEWRSRQSAHLAPDPITLRTKICQGLAWHGHSVVFEAPAVGKGGSYHLELRAPEGTQIRRATLALIKPTNGTDAPAPEAPVGGDIVEVPGRADETTAADDPASSGAPAPEPTTDAGSVDESTPAEDDADSETNQSDLDAIRGARSLQRAHLYVGNVTPGAPR